MGTATSAQCLISGWQPLCSLRLLCQPRHCPHLPMLTRLLCFTRLTRLTRLLCFTRAPAPAAQRCQDDHAQLGGAHHPARLLLPGSRWACRQALPALLLMHGAARITACMFGQLWMPMPSKPLPLPPPPLLPPLHLQWA